jgi:hypothetical protein
VLARSAIAEAGGAEFEAVAMPAGGHEILGQARQSVERRARALLMQLQELEDERVAETVDDEGAGG